MPGFHFTLAFDGDLADVLTLKLVPDPLAGGAGDLDLSALAVAFHAAGGVDHVAPFF